MKRASALLLLASWTFLHGQTTTASQGVDESVEFIQHAPRTEAEASALEQTLVANPDDRLAHIHLFGYYWSQATFYNRKDVRHKLVAQADWFAVHEPDSAVFDRSAFAIEKTDFDPPYADERSIYKAHWKSAADRHLNDAKVLSHALQALHAVDIEVPLLCSTHLRAFFPAYPQYAVDMALYLAELIIYQSKQATASDPGDQNRNAFTVLMNSDDSAVIGLTGQLLYGRARLNAKTEAYLAQAEALLKKAHELDPSNQRWLDALQSPPPENLAAAVAAIDTLTQEDLWTNGKVPPIEGSSDAIVVDALTQAARRSSPSDAFVRNVLSASHLGPGNVKITALIGEDGKVRVLQFESGSVRHFATALGMVKDWRYTPPLGNGKPVKVLTTINLNYTAYVQPQTPPAAGGVMGGILGTARMGGDPMSPGNSALRANPPKKILVSGAVIAGNILSKTAPVYPAVAKAARIQGIVVLQATISKAGLIEGLQVLSGPPLLQQAALDAVNTWKYKPYLLNGEPVQVGTTVNVVFSLGDYPATPPPPAQAPPQ